MAGTAILAGLLLCGACAGGEAPIVDPDAAARGWRAVATPADRVRLRQWRLAWTTALPAARAADAATIAADPALFDPDAGLPDAMPPPGDYRCRTIKLGQGAGGLGIRPGLVAYPEVTCRIGADGSYTSTGRQRHSGRLFADTDARAVYLGTLVLGDEVRAITYGRDGGRNVIGLVERIGPARWRLSMPLPRYESCLDFVELVPAR